MSSNHISNPRMDRSHAEQLRTAHDYHYGFQSTLQIYNHNANQYYYKSLQIDFTTKSIIDVIFFDLSGHKMVAAYQVWIYPAFIDLFACQSAHTKKGGEMDDSL